MLTCWTDERLSVPIPVAVDTNSNDARNGLPPAMPWGALLPPSMERTLPSHPIDAKATDGSWQIVNGTRFKFFVFSAYYDRRGGKLIRVIGATKTRGPEKVWCRFWYPYGNATHQRYRSASVMARVKVCKCQYVLCMSVSFRNSCHCILW